MGAGVGDGVRDEEREKGRGDPKEIERKRCGGRSGGGERPSA
jgi:hypothetical protein